MRLFGGLAALLCLTISSRRFLALGLLSILPLGSKVFATEYRLLDVDRLDFEYSRLQPGNRDPLAPQYTGLWRERAGLQWDLRLLEYGYWRNHLHTETVQPGGEVKTVGWEWETGIEAGKYLDVFYHHHSRHLMDEKVNRQFDTTNQFPVENSIGVRVHLLRDKR